MLPAMRRITVCALLLLLATASAASAQDTVTVSTGEKIVGEIINVEKDVLTMSTPYSDSDFKIEWGQVVAIDSARQFLIETFDGRRITGALKADTANKSVQVGSVAELLADVSTMQPIQRTFWSRFETALDFGYSMTRANEAKQLTVGGTLLYRDEDVVDSVVGNVFHSSQSNAPRRNGGISATTSATSSANAGTRTRDRTS